MKLSEEIIISYSEKIYGYAYGKLRDPDKAGDLSQEIMLNLLKSSAKNTETDNPDGFVYTVCRYTFAGYLRKKYRQNKYEGICIDNATFIPSDESVENSVELSMMKERLMREISRLAKIHRDITVMFYFENISTAEIAEKLGLSGGTVRWYLGESRKKLKEGIDMNENLSFNPIRMWAGHDGYAEDMNMKGLGKDPLVTNIAWACYKDALTVEEISRETGVAAVYLEYHINQLVKMNYLKKTGNKYRTNFYIQSVELADKHYEYIADNAEALTQRSLEVLKSRLDEILSIGFMGNDIDRDRLIWAFYGDMMYTAVNTYLSTITENGRKYKDISRPMRADGSEHWVCAGLVPDKGYESKISKKAAEFKSLCLNGNGIKIRESETARSIQFDYGTAWREFSTDEICELCHIRELILSGCEMNNHDKLIAAKMAKDGYIIMQNGIPHMNIPFMTASEHDVYSNIINEIITDLGDNFLAEYITGSGKLAESDIPEYLDSDLILYFKYHIISMWDFFHMANYKKMLKLPEDLNHSGFATMVWLK